MEDDETLLLSDLAEAAGVSKAAWVRGAVRAASDSQAIAQPIATHADKTGWGGCREGAGRPRRSGSTDRQG
ncbi:hypothetical protein GCM10020260_26310 [Nesterenkonia halobia]|uniref:Ribbon-helix-helix protein CopG domain-containing protein n=1 Tax=Nesterenkonia halobia TaxID=37922 RepID=A0ABP6RG47_9MICC